MPNLPAMPPLLAASETGALIVAGLFIGMVTLLTGIALIKEGSDGGLKMFSALGTITGLLAGVIGTYFFTKESNQQALAKKDAEKAAVLAQVGELEAKLAETRNLRVITFDMPKFKQTPDIKFEEDFLKHRFDDRKDQNEQNAKQE